MKLTSEEAIRRIYMSEEEREKAYEFLQELEKNGYRYTADGREKYIIENVFKPISKLQKENEELKERYEIQKDINIALKEDTKKKFVSKDKIKDKIKELKEDMVQNGKTIDILYDILEGE